MVDEKLTGSAEKDKKKEIHDLSVCVILAYIFSFMAVCPRLCVCVSKRASGVGLHQCVCCLFLQGSGGRGCSGSPDRHNDCRGRNNSTYDVSSPSPRSFWIHKLTLSLGWGCLWQQDGWCLQWLCVFVCVCACVHTCMCIARCELTCLWVFCLSKNSLIPSPSLPSFHLLCVTHTVFFLWMNSWGERWERRSWAFICCCWWWWYWEWCQCA